MRFYFLFLYLFAISAYGAIDTLQFKELEKKARSTYGSNLDSSIFYCQKILELCEKEDYVQGHAFALNWTGICLMRKGYPDSAETFYQRTIQYSLHNDANKYVQMARLNRSINYFQKGNYEDAAAAAEESLNSFASIGDTLGMAHAQYNLANCLFRLNRYEEALSFYFAAENTYNAKGGALNRANVANAIGSVFNEYKKYDSAILKFKESIKIKTDVGGANFCASEYNNIGMAHRSMDNSDSAIFYFRKSCVTAATLGDQGKMATAQGNLASEFNKIGMYDSAIHFAHQSSELSKKIEDSFIQYVSAFQLAQAYAAKSEFSKAYDYQQEYMATKDSSEKIEVAERISDLEKRYRLAESERKITAQNLEIAKSNVIVQRQVMIIILMLLVMIAVLVWFRNKRKQQLVKHGLEMNRERNRIAMDLHDHLGAELTVISSRLDTSVYKAERAADKESLTNISDQVRQAGKTLRETVWSIQSESITTNQLLYKLQDFATKMFENSNVSYTFKEDTPNEILAPQVALDSYRIFQEAITNATKYSKARTIGFEINRDNAHIDLMLTDDGIGFNPADSKNGFGLKNMQLRADAINATLSISSNKDVGTTVHLKLPMA